ncbi:MAG: abortive infection bacteriophage resistance protein [Psychroserpens sp.]|jgi:abortive infection bacteriophage resistance protein
MSKKTYDKAPLTFHEQIGLLKSRNLSIAPQDEHKILSYLQEISYYRLSAYFLPYQRTKDTFNKDVTFDNIIKTYSFDRELRLLIFDCIERIEVAIRTQMIYQMAIKYNDSHWQDNQSLFITPYYNKVGRTIDPYNDFQGIMSRAKTVRRPEVFIEHYIDTYNKPSNPPAWMSFELLTMGDLSYLYKGLKHNEDKKMIADFFDVHYTVFTSWLHSLTYVRNVCAHHSRLWNKDLAIEPGKLLKPKGKWISSRFQNNKRLFYFICVLKYLLLRANPNNSLKDKLAKLFEKYPTVPIQYLGIPSDGKGNLLDWKNEALWK